MKAGTPCVRARGCSAPCPPWVCHAHRSPELNTLGTPPQVLSSETAPIAHASPSPHPFKQTQVGQELIPAPRTQECPQTPPCTLPARSRHVGSARLVQWLRGPGGRLDHCGPLSLSPTTKAPLPLSPEPGGGPSREPLLSSPGRTDPGLQRVLPQQEVSPPLRGGCARGPLHPASVSPHPLFQPLPGSTPRRREDSPAPVLSPRPECFRVWLCRRPACTFPAQGAPVQQQGSSWQLEGGPQDKALHLRRQWGSRRPSGGGRGFPDIRSPRNYPHLP